MGVPVEAKPAAAAPQSGALIPVQGIPVEPMGSRIPSAARPAAMQRSVFDMPRAEAKPVVRAQAEPVREHPAVVARPVPPLLGERAAPKRMGQGSGSAPVTAAEAGELVTYLDDALDSLRRQPSSDPGCAAAVQRVRPLREALARFAGTAKEGDTLPLGADELAALDKTFSCALLAKRTLEAAGLAGTPALGQAGTGPNTGAYVALGLAVAATVVVLNL